MHSRRDGAGRAEEPLDPVLVKHPIEKNDRMLGSSQVDRMGSGPSKQDSWLVTGESSKVDNRTVFSLQMKEDEVQRRHHHSHLPTCGQSVRLDEISTS